MEFCLILWYYDITNAYETRNEMVSFELLKRMWKEMKERALFYRGAENITLSQLDYRVESAVKSRVETSCRFRIDVMIICGGSLAKVIRFA